MEFKNCFMNKQDLKKKSQAASTGPNSFVWKQKGELKEPNSLHIEFQLS